MSCAFALGMISGSVVPEGQRGCPFFREASRPIDSTAPVSGYHSGGDLDAPDLFLEPIAHLRDDTEEPLELHMLEVATCAETFTAHFDAADWGRVLGAWHDLGKYRIGFQRHIRGEDVPRSTSEHSIAGACLVAERFPKGELGKLLAFAIAGHHAGLANETTSDDGPRPLDVRLKSGRVCLDEIREVAAPWITEFALSEPAITRRREGEAENAHRRRRALWLRMLFSALVDADYLATEAFMQPGKARSRRLTLEIGGLDEQLRRVIDAKMAGLPPEDRGREVNRARSEILHHCRAAALHPPGFFSLTVPTGAGKTLSAMSFALDHAAQHDLRRVIVVLPFTTILEQNAGVYAAALGAENVLEHHSNLTNEHRAKKLNQEQTNRHELAEENWDAPIVVTTTVQFFESFFANRPSKCRKLHNVTKSVIVLDEVQALPRGFLLPILELLKNLVADYGCTVVLSTATPPALRARMNFPGGLPVAHSIVPDEADYFRRLARVRYHWNIQEEEPWESLVGKIAGHERVLAVVHKRADARIVAEMLAEISGESVWHLSALMCPAHRSALVAEIKQHLLDKKPCRVVSTQLIEAGVDLDFPVVYRALAGLDSIVQAAGRCNREGREPWGDIYVFRAPTKPPKGILSQALLTTELMWNVEGELDPNDPAVFERFFKGLYGAQGTQMDLRHVQRALQEWNFATAAKSFKLIDDAGQFSVVCPWGDGPKHLDAFREASKYERLSRNHHRALRPYMVSVYASQARELMDIGALLEVVPGSDLDLWEINPIFKNAYTELYGLTLQGVQADPESLVL